MCENTKATETSKNKNSNPNPRTEKRKTRKREKRKCWCVKLDQKGKGPWKGNKSCTNKKHQDQGSNAGSESSKGKKSDQSQKRNDSSNGSKEWKFDKRKVRCHNCQKLGHYAQDCWQGEGAKNKSNNHANLAQDEG